MCKIAVAQHSINAESLVVKLHAPNSFQVDAELALARLSGPSHDHENAQLQGLAGHPVAVKYLKTERMTPEQRRALDDSSPAEQLHRWLVLDYDSAQHAAIALATIRMAPTVFLEAAQRTSSFQFSVLPSDPLYSFGANSYPIGSTGYYVESPKGVHERVGLPVAWNLVAGHAYVAIVDTGIEAALSGGALVPHSDLEKNVRLHFSRNTTDDSLDVREIGVVRQVGFPPGFGHGTHVAGIVSARPNNTYGASGACWYCSLMIMRMIPAVGPSGTNGFTCQSLTEGLRQGIRNGAQVVNLSFGADTTCPFGSADRADLDLAISEAVDRQVTITAAAGNPSDYPPGVSGVQYPARNTNVLSVAASTASGVHASFSVNNQGGSAGQISFAVPGERILSTFFTGGIWSSSGIAGNPAWACQSLTSPNEFGYCSGTSMAAPLMAGAVGVVRSANPLLSHTDVKTILAANSFYHGAPGAQTANTSGSGVPDVGLAVADALALNGGVTPLFILLNSQSKHFYTSVPQMARSAIDGKLRHGGNGTWYAYAAAAAAEGSNVSGYSAFPGTTAVAPRAAVKLFTMVRRNGQNLVPLYRLSHENGTHAYAAGDADLANFPSPFVLDGIEGYLFPTNNPGTVAVQRSFHAGLSDYVIYPADQQSYFAAQGYSGHSVIGYACPMTSPTGACAPIPPRTSNLSTRALVLTGNDVMIAGFVIAGGDKTVAIAVAGPSLAAYGISNPLANPTVTLMRSSDQAVLATNDDWQAAPNAAQIQASGFAPANPLEPAVLVTLPPGAYTAVVSGVGGGTGTAVVGLYEANPGEAGVFSNVSTRAYVGSGNDVMIGGFTITGQLPVTVAVVGTGPSLAPYGLNALGNPTLTVVRNSDQMVVASSDDWESTPTAKQLQVINPASSYAPTNALEAGVVVTLEPGAYTAILSGVSGGTGVGIVGVYPQP